MAGGKKIVMIKNQFFHARQPRKGIFIIHSHRCTEVQNDRFSSGEFYKLDLNGNELLKLISPFSSPNEPNFLQ